MIRTQNIGTPDPMIMRPKNNADILVIAFALTEDNIDSMSAGGLGNAMAPRTPKLG